MPNNTSAAGYYTEEWTNDVLPNRVRSPKYNHGVRRALVDKNRLLKAAFFTQRVSYFNDENLRGGGLEEVAKMREELEDDLNGTKEVKTHLEAAMKEFERRNEAKQLAQQIFQEEETGEHIDAPTQDEDKTSVTAQTQPEAAMERPSLMEDIPGQLKASRGQYW